MGLSWQQGPLAPAAVGRFLTPIPLPERLGSIADGVLEDGQHVTSDRDLGATSWYTVRVGGQSTARAAWHHTDLPEYAGELQGRVAFVWRAMDAFYEEDQRIFGHAADLYHRTDIRPTSRQVLPGCVA